MNQTEAIAEMLYSTYSNAVGGKAFNGDTLPDWQTFRNDPSKVKQTTGWIACAEAVIIRDAQRRVEQIEQQNRP
jgi:hypothetical protein